MGEPCRLDEENLIELEMLLGLVGESQVSAGHRVESSTEYSQRRLATRWGNTLRSAADKAQHRC